MGSYLSTLVGMSSTIADRKYPTHNHKIEEPSNTCRLCNPKPWWVE